MTKVKLSEVATIKTRDGTIIESQEDQRAGPSGKVNDIMDHEEYMTMLEENETLIELKAEKDKDDSFIKRTRRRPGKFKMQAKYDKKPGRVHYTSSEEINKMNNHDNAMRLKQEARLALPEFAKEFKSQDGNRNKLLFLILNIEFMYNFMYNEEKKESMTSFSVTELHDFIHKHITEINKGSVTEMMVQISREFCRMGYMAKEGDQLRIIDSQIKDHSVEDWSEELLRRNKRYKKLSPKKKEEYKLQTEDKPKPRKSTKKKTVKKKTTSPDFDIKDAGKVPLAGSSKAETTRTQPLLSITLNVYSIEELNKVLKRLGTG